MKSGDNLYLAIEHLRARGIFKSLSFQLKGRHGTDYFEFDQISEGEKQLLAVVGALNLINRTENLVLLDEPDTHLNPHWSWDYPEMLSDALDKTQKLRSTVLMATHAPVMISGSAIALCSHQRSPLAHQGERGNGGMAVGSSSRRRLSMRWRPVRASSSSGTSKCLASGVRVRPTGGKVYVLRLRVDGRQRWYTVGKHGDPWTPDTARDEADRVPSQAANVTKLRQTGSAPASLRHPIEAREHGKAAPTLAEFAKRYLAGKAVPHKAAATVEADRGLLGLREMRTGERGDPSLKKR